jgi:hypothetical protein
MENLNFRFWQQLLNIQFSRMQILCISAAVHPPSSETSVTVYRTTWRYNTKVRSLNTWVMLAQSVMVLNTGLLIDVLFLVSAETVLLVLTPRRSLYPPSRLFNWIEEVYSLGCRTHLHQELRPKFSLQVSILKQMCHFSFILITSDLSLHKETTVPAKQHSPGSVVGWITDWFRPFPPSWILS